MNLSFFVEGIPRPQGSKSATIRGGRPVVFEVSKHVDSWRKLINRSAQVEAIRLGVDPVELPITVRLHFFFERPKYHRKMDGSLRKGIRSEHTVRPDIDKLARAVLDALTGVAFKDDSQVISLKATKAYGDAAGVQVEVQSIGNDYEGIDTSPGGN